MSILLLYGMGFHKSPAFEYMFTAAYEQDVI